MQPKENGRHCDSCQKTVIDFRNKTDEEIIRYLRDNAGNHTCGAFRKSQVGSGNPPGRDKRAIRFLAALLLVFGTALFSCSPEPKKPEAPLEILGGPVFNDTSNISDSLSAGKKSYDTIHVSDKSIVVQEDTVPRAERSFTFTPPETEEQSVEDKIIPDTAPAPPDPPVLGMVAEPEPEFPGGTTALQQYIRDHFHLPADADYSGTIYVSFIVEPDGRTDSVKILRGLTPELDKEAVRIVKEMPPWKPAKQNGITVRTRYNLPLKIHLQ